jgi:Cation transporter/ATPase, N-terminus
MTTCPAICVADVADCPTRCTGNTTLCVSGSCEETCGLYNYHEEANPCACEALPIACPKVVDYFDECTAPFQSFYDAYGACLESQSEATPLVSFTGPYFVLCYVWILSVSALVMAWCYFNEKLCPNKSKTTAALDAVSAKSSSGQTAAKSPTQTGYRRELLGTFIYVLVIITFIAFQFLLFLTTIFYYMQQEVITRWSPVFEDEAQALQAFIMTWMIGLPWTISFRYVNTGIRNLFLRRCPLKCATHVAVRVPVLETRTDRDHAGILARVAGDLQNWTENLLRAIFSYSYNSSGEEALFCEVHVDLNSESRGFYHHMSRYIFDEKTSSFVPARLRIGKTLGDFASQADGLSSSEVTARMGLVGPNDLAVARPTILSSLFKEFSKPFYVFQVRTNLSAAHQTLIRSYR